MDPDIRAHPLLADLVDGGLGHRNALGGLTVDEAFEVQGARSGPGRIYASGPAVRGGPYAPVDTLLGLQYAALTITDALAGLGACRRIGCSRSIAAWWRWMRGRPVDATEAESLPTMDIAPA